MPTLQEQADQLAQMLGPGWVSDVWAFDKFDVRKNGVAVYPSVHGLQP